MASRKVIQIGEHKIQLPPFPESKDQILFHGENDPYWRRQTDFPRIFFDYNKYHTKINQDNTQYDNNEGHLISLSVDDTATLKRLQTRELNRRRYGLWMKNGKDIIWLAPDYYFNLQWGPMLSLAKKYGDFRWFQNDAMILKHHVDHDGNRLGFYISKAKKTGITQIMAGAYANESTMVRGKNFGIMSKTFDEDAKALNMALYFHIIENLPDILLPEEKKRNEHEIIFGVGKAHKQLKTPTKPLNTRVYASKTKPSGFDGPVMWKDWLDEFPKYWESAKQSPDLVFKKTQETVKLQQQINGKMYITSYSPEDDNRGFYEAKKIYEESKLATQDKILGRTKSGLLCHFIGTLESAEGCFLPNGKTDQKKAFYFNEAERDAVKGDRLQLQAKQRQYPRTEDEAWGIGGKSSVFDTIRIGIQIKEVEAELLTGVRPYKEGKLLWTNSMWEAGKFDIRPSGMFSPIYFEPLTDEQIMKGEEERLLIYEMPGDEEICRGLKANNRDEYNRLMPLDDSINVGGVDPTDYAAKSDVIEGSKNASLTMNIYDPILDTRKGRVASNILMSEYFFRPENPDEFYEDLVKEILFFDKRVIVEANKKWVVTRLKNDNLHNYLLLLKPDGTIAPYKEGDDDRLVNTTHSLIDAYIRAIKRYLAQVKNGGVGIDYLFYQKCLRILKQLVHFKADDTKKFDLVVALGLTRLAAEAFSIFRLDLIKDDDDTETIKMLMRKIKGW